MKQFNVRVGLGIILCGLLSGSLLANQATAASFTYNFTGDVIKIPTALSSSQYSTASLMSGFITVNTTPDLHTPATHDKIGDFLITALKVNIGTYSAGLGSGANNLEIKTNGIQAFTVTAPANGLTPLNVCCSFSPSSFDIKLKGVLGFTSDDPSTVSPSISSFLTQNSWRLVFSNGKAISGNIQNLTAAVPLPAAVILFGAGIVALVGLGAGSWRQKKNSLA